MVSYVSLLIYAGHIYQLYYFLYGKVFMRTSSGYLGIVLLPIFISLGIVYLVSGIRYKKSKKFRGRVIDSKEVEIVHFGRDGGEIYETYYVSYAFRGKILKGEVRTTETGLRPGAKIDVYVYDPEGVHEIQSDIDWKHFKLYAMAGSVMVIMFLIFGLIAWGMEHIDNDSNYKNTVTFGNQNHTYELSEEFIENNEESLEYLHDKYGIEYKTAE